MPQLQKIIEEAWEKRATIKTTTQGEIRDSVTIALNNLDLGKIRVAEKTDKGWEVNQWVKKAILLSFRLNDMEILSLSSLFSNTKCSNQAGNNTPIPSTG